MHDKNNEIIKIGKSQIFSDNSCVNIFSHNLDLILRDFSLSFTVTIFCDISDLTQWRMNGVGKHRTFSQELDLMSQLPRLYCCYLPLLSLFITFREKEKHLNFKKYISPYMHLPTLKLFFKTFPHIKDKNLKPDYLRTLSEPTHNYFLMTKLNKILIHRTC